MCCQGEKYAPAARLLIQGIWQQDKGLLSAGHRYLQIINQSSFQKAGIVNLLHLRSPFQPCGNRDFFIELFRSEERRVGKEC